MEYVEAGITTDEAKRNALEFSASSRVSWGEEHGEIFGVLKDDTKIDRDGKTRN